MDEIVTDVDLAQDAFRQCMLTVDEEIRRHIAEATRLGVAATPTLFVGELGDTRGTVRLRRRINGAASFETVKAAVEDVGRAKS